MMKKASSNTNGSNWHSKQVKEVIENLKTDPVTGLSDEEIKNRTETYGANEIPRGKKQSEIKRFMLQFHNLLIYILLAAAVITALVEDPFMNRFFETEPSAFLYWIYPGIAAFLVFVIVEIEKYTTRSWWK